MKKNLIKKEYVKKIKLYEYYNKKYFDENLSEISDEIYDKLKNEIIGLEKKYKYLVNKNSQVLFENKLENQEKYFGRNEYGDPVIVESKTDLTGKILKVKINHFNKNSLFGEIENNNKRDFAA